LVFEVSSPLKERMVERECRRVLREILGSQNTHVATNRA
jgi:hypothetical protein